MAAVSSPVNILVVQRLAHDTAILTFYSLVQCRDTLNTCIVFGVYALLVKSNDCTREIPAIESCVQSDSNLPAADQSLIAEVMSGLVAGIEPESINEGLAGVHLMKSPDKKPRAVFKPRTEEFGCAANPKGASEGQELKRGIEPGLGYLRERAAYVVDQRDRGAAGVPVTTVTTLPLLPSSEPVVGALQEYVEHDCDAEDLGASCFALDEVHNMALLDMRLANCDRHVGNILVQRGRRSTRSTTASSITELADDDDADDADAGVVVNSDDDDDRSQAVAVRGGGGGGDMHIVPIDHGCVLPTELADVYFGWQYWPQTSLPLSSATRARVLALNPTADMAAVHAAAPDLPDAALLVGEVCGTLVQRACGVGQLSVRAVADMMTRGINDHPSVLEQLCAAAAASVAGGATLPWRASDWCRDGNARAAFLAALRSEIDRFIATR